MSSRVTLYYSAVGEEWELLPEKLFVVENLSTYLSSKTSKLITAFQYIKHGLEISINVDLSQYYASPKSNSYKYVSIINDGTGENTYYYFVKSVEWRSKSAVRFNLIMDVLNTFTEKRDYFFKANTRILREHKNRFSTNYNDRYLSVPVYGSDTVTLDPPALNQYASITQNIDGTGIIFTGILVDLIWEAGEVTLAKFLIPYEDTRTDPQIINSFSGYPEGYEYYIIGEDENILSCAFDDGQGGTTFEDVEITRLTTLYRNIDNISEGINPILHHVRNTKINDTGIKNQDWYLLYRNQNNPSDSLVNPVDCYLIPENQTDIDNGVVTNGRIIASTLNANTYYYAKLTPSVVMSLSNGVTITGSTPRRRGMIITKQSNGLMTISLFTESDPIGFTMNFDASYDDISYIAFSAFPIYYYSSLTPIDAYDWYDIFNHDQENHSWTDDYAGDYLDSVDLLDRTDAKNIKLIKLPYCPYDFSVSGDVIQVSGTDWFYTTISQDDGDIKVIKLNDLNTKLSHEITTRTTAFTDLYLGIWNPQYTDLRYDIGAKLESKLFHSDFYNPSYVYDSFALKVDLEKCDIDYYISHFNLYYKMNFKFTTTRTINSKFLFTFTDYSSKKAISNFYNVIPVARNNEEVLYNVPYINYIRAGYNYDVKNKNISFASNMIGLGLSATSMAASLFLPSVPLKVAGIVGSLVSMAMSVKNTIVTTIQNEDSIKRKITETQNQASSVAGSDDVDLMSEYCGNRLQYLVYRPTDEMWELLNNLFFYAGYSSNRMGIPTHNNRINFDYLECEASIEKLISIPDDCLQELINSFKNGVTYIHDRGVVGSRWDFAQKYENWEKMFFN